LDEYNEKPQVNGVSLAYETILMYLLNTWIQSNIINNPMYSC
jgi:hypothetical protein